MPIDPNIALSYRQPEPVNMLGQLGQVMAIKAAQQEMEGYEGVKSALSGGMEATDPRLLQYGKRGIEAFRAANEGRIKQLEAGKKQSELMGNIFGGVLQDPSSGPQALQSLVSMGVVSKDQAAEIMTKAGNDPAAWKALAKPYYDQSIDATKRFQDETERWKANLQAQVTREGHGVQMYGHNITARGQDMANWRHMNKPGEVKVIDNQPVNITTVNGQPVVTSMAEPLPVGTPAPSFAPTGGGYGGGGVSTPRNAMVQPQSAPAPVNALVAQPATQQQTPAAAPQKPWTIEKIPEGYRKTADGNLEYIPGGPKDPNVQAEQSTAKLDAKTLSMREAAYPQATNAVKNLSQNADTLLADLKALKEHKGLPGITGFVSGRTLNVTGDARAAQALLDKILATGTLGVLTDLRNASKTGGALGNVSNKDTDLLTKAFGALSQVQNTKDFQNALDDAIHKVEMSKQNANEAYDTTYEYRKKSGKTSAPSKDDPLGLR